MKRYYQRSDVPQDWIDCVYDRAKGARGPAIDLEPPDTFKSYASEIIEGQIGYGVDHWVYWGTVHEPQNEGEWMPKFPHNHNYDGLTLVQYLEAPDKGGELVLLNSDMSAESTYFPRVGGGAIIKDHEIHGVKAVYGQNPRTVIIAGAFPYPKRWPKCACTAEWTHVFV